MSRRVLIAVLPLVQIVIDVQLAKVGARQQRIPFTHKVTADLESLRFAFHP